MVQPRSLVYMTQIIGKISQKYSAEERKDFNGRR